MAELWLQKCAEAQQRGEAFPEEPLFRTLIQHTTFFPRPGPTDHVDVYLCDFTTRATGGDETGPLDGLQLAASLPSGLTSLRFHFSADAPPLECNAQQAASFASFLQVTVIEQLLLRVQAGAELELEQPFAKLRHFRHFFVLSAHPAGAAFAADAPLRLALVPDPEGGRRLAAAFTAEDALQLFVAAREATTQSLTEELVSVELSGAELFTHLAAVKVDGIVFNPCGPTPPIALQHGIAQAILDDP